MFDGDAVLKGQPRKAGGREQRDQERVDDLQGQLTQWEQGQQGKDRQAALAADAVLPGQRDGDRGESPGEAHDEPKVGERCVTARGPQQVEAGGGAIAAALFEFRSAVGQKIVGCLTFQRNAGRRRQLHR